LLSTVVNAAVVGVVGLVLAWLGKGRFEAMDRRIDRLEERLEARMDAFQASLDAMRSDLTQVALAVGARGRATNA
jgi:hypothetical protein